MPTKYQTDTGQMVETANGPEPRFPIYFCEECGYQGAAFGTPKADGRLSYCGWDGRRPVCVGKGRKNAS